MSVRRFLTLFEETGDVSPAIQQHGPPRAFEDMSLIQLLLNKPKIYLEELRQELIEISGTDVKREHNMQDTKVPTLFKKVVTLYREVKNKDWSLRKKWLISRYAWWMWLKQEEWG